MKKIISLVLAVFLCASVFAAEPTARFVTSEAAKKDSVEESVSYIKTQINKMTVASKRHAIKLSTKDDLNIPTSRSIVRRK